MTPPSRSIVRLRAAAATVLILACPGATQGADRWPAPEIRKIVPLDIQQTVAFPMRGRLGTGDASLGLSPVAAKEVEGNAAASAESLRPYGAG